MPEKYISVAIDGPVGAGKSTIARECAKRLGFVYVDTGALYRAVGLFCTRRGTELSDFAAVAACLPDITLDLKIIDGTQRVYLCGEDVSEEIRLPEISMAASAVSAVPAVREALLDLQRDMAKTHDVIMDGRDIGTVVLPNADLKIFLTASPEIRARRRCDELCAKGKDVAYEDVLADLNTRDYNDSHRAIAPLKKADDAVEVDSSDLTFEQVAGRICSLAEECRAGR